LCEDQYYSKKRVQIMEDGGGSCWFLDYDPAPEGKMGQVICVFRDQPEIVYNCFESFEELLQTVISEMENGKVKLVEGMSSFDFSITVMGTNFYLNRSALYRKNNPNIPDDFFTKLSPQWLFAVSEDSHNPIINRDGNWAKPQEALAVKEIFIREAQMMDHFVEVMKYLPNVMFLRICKEALLEEKHYEIIKKLRLHTLAIECPVKHIASLTNTESLRSLALARMYDADISEIAVYKNVIKLDIQRKNDDSSLAFLLQMPNVQELQLWHEELTIVNPENVKVIEQMPNLNNLSCFKTKATNFENIIARPSPFFSHFAEELGFVR
jgi:uncharacterized protein YkvS